MMDHWLMIGFWISSLWLLLIIIGMRFFVSIAQTTIVIIVSLFVSLHYNSTIVIHNQQMKMDVHDVRWGSP